MIPEHQLTDGEKAVLDECVKVLSSPSSSSSSLSSAVLPLFDRVLSCWPLDKLFPVLAIYRLLLLRNDVIDIISSLPLSHYDRILQVIEKNETDEKVKIPLAAKIMALCCLSNLFSSTKLALLCSHHQPFHRVALSTLNNDDQSLRLMASTLLYNIIIATPKSDENDELIELLLPLSESLLKEKDSECCHRMLLSLSNAIYGNSASSLVFMSMEVDLNPLKTKFEGSAVVNTKIQSLINDINVIVEADKKRTMGD